MDVSCVTPGLAPQKISEHLISVSPKGKMVTGAGSCAGGAQKHSLRSYFCAPARIRTQNNGSEDRCDIHFTTEANLI